MPSLPKPPSKPKARRGGRAAKPRKPGLDKGLVCRFIVDRVGRGEEECGQVLANPKQANTHLSRRHDLSGAAKTAALSGMNRPCGFRIEDGIQLPERDHDWKLMAGEETFHSWCLGCGAIEESTAVENQTWVDDMDEELKLTRKEFGDCAMGQCSCESRTVAADEVFAPLDHDVHKALKLAANPHAVREMIETERWTAHQLLVGEANRRALAIPPEQAVVMSYEDEDGNYDPKPVTDNCMDEHGIRALLHTIEGFGLFEDPAGMEQATVQALALAVARKNRWTLPECQRSTWIPVDLEDEDEANSGTA